MVALYDSEKAAESLPGRLRAAGIESGSLTIVRVETPERRSTPEGPIQPARAKARPTREPIDRPLVVGSLVGVAIGILIGLQPLPDRLPLGAIPGGALLLITALLLTRQRRRRGSLPREETPGTNGSSAREWFVAIKLRRAEASEAERIARLSGAKEVLP